MPPLPLAATAHNPWKLKLAHTEALTTPATNTLTLFCLLSSSCNPELAILGELAATMQLWRWRCQAAQACAAGAIAQVTQMLPQSLTQPLPAKN